MNIVCFSGQSSVRKDNRQYFLSVKDSIVTTLCPSVCLYRGREEAADFTGRSGGFQKRGDCGGQTWDAHRRVGQMWRADWGAQRCGGQMWRADLGVLADG